MEGKRRGRKRREGGGREGRGEERRGGGRKEKGEENKGWREKDGRGKERRDEGKKEGMEGGRKEKRREEREAGEEGSFCPSPYPQVDTALAASPEKTEVNWHPCNHPVFALYCAQVPARMIPVLRECVNGVRMGGSQMMPVSVCLSVVVRCRAL